MTGLEKLKVLLYGEEKDKFGRTNFPQRLEIAKELEKELKALEVIRKYYVFEENQFYPFKRKNITTCETKEEYDLLKEVLL